MGHKLAKKYKPIQVDCHAIVEMFSKQSIGKYFYDIS